MTTVSRKPFIMSFWSYLKDTFNRLVVGRKSGSTCDVLSRDSEDSESLNPSYESEKHSLDRRSNKSSRVLATIPWLLTAFFASTTLSLFAKHGEQPGNKFGSFERG